MLEEAQERLSKIEMKGETETVRVVETLRRVCAEYIYAVISQPPFSRSPLDGYTVRNQDTAGASEANPIRLNVIEYICAGTYPKLKIGPGEAARTMTGTPAPEGADGIIMQERTDERSESVEIHQSVTVYGNYCKKDENTCRGAPLMEKGRSIRSFHIGILSSQGIESVPVYPVPVAGIVTTGDKLAPVGTPLEPGKICDNSGPSLATRIKELGTKLLLLGREGDDTAQLAREVRRRLTGCDALITDDDVSLGVRDCMPYVVEVFGTGVLFHGINIKPGSPMLAVLMEDKPAFCPPGDPFMTATTLEVLMRPILERMRGRAWWKPGILFGILESPFPKPSPTRRLMKDRIEDGRVWLPEGRYSSGILFSVAGCNCLVDVPAGSDELRARE